MTTRVDPEAHPFDVDTAAEVDDAGNHGVDLTDRWDRLGGGPLGGYSMAICLRSIGMVVPFDDPLAVSAFFHRPAVHGPGSLVPTLVRAGQTTATGEAALVQDGKERVRVTATFTDLAAASGRHLVLNAPPDLPPPDRCVDPLDGISMDGVTIVDRVEYRMAESPGWRNGRPSGNPTVECWIRFKEERAPDLMSVPLLVDAVAPTVMEIGALGSSTIELTVHLRAIPAPGWLACRATTRHVIAGYHEEDFEIWDSTGALVAQSRQLARLAEA